MVDMYNLPKPIEEEEEDEEEKEKKISLESENVRSDMCS